MKQDGGILIFNNGRRIDTFTNGSIGVDNDGNMFVGYDGCLYTNSEANSELLTADELLSIDEAIELCLYMKEQWRNKLIDLVEIIN